MTSPLLRELPGLSDNFDDDLAKSMLEIKFDKIVHPHDALTKSLYNFDLETPEGVDRLLELLPIMDPEIINEIYQEIFPSYPVDTLAPRVARTELRGYLMDYLNGEFEAGQEEKEAAEESGLEGPEPGAAGAPSPVDVAEQPPEGGAEQAPTPEAGPEDGGPEALGE